ncbi:hypothetical protein KSS87_018653 [Heliosperma pusillum]|nr:hypothetical protein KSS87_021748 [Heliosperma pusillum]KAH9619377.1 hypothetical protein KSS87_018653 [Heliosperma pusillum]
MAPQVATIATLTPSKSRYQLTARATRIWEVAASQNTQSLSLDMVLLDKEGNQIHTTIPKKMVSSYKENLHEGKIYRLQHFEVAKNNRSYKPVISTDNIIRCTPFTTIAEEEDQSTPIPQHKFEFHPINSLHERSNKIDYLIDVVGLLTTIENKRQVMTKGGLTLLRHAYIQDERKETVRVTLWGEAANLIDETMVEMKKDEVKIVVITSMKVVYYEGADQLQSTYGTKIYINLDIPEATKLRQSLDELTPVTIIDISKEIHVPEPPFKSLKELLEMELPDEKEMFICQGAITEVRTDVDWRYRIMTTISDGFAFAKLVLFDKEAETVIGKPINKLLDIYEQENGKGRVFDILQQCIGKQHKFKVKVGMSRFGYERELKGQKTFPTNEDIETKIVATQESEKAPMQQEEPSLPRIEWKAPVQTPDKTEKRKKAEKTGKGDKDIKMEGSSAKKKRSVAVSETST